LEVEHDAFLRNVERHGFTFDVDACQALQTKIERRLVRLQRYLDHYFPPTVVIGKKPAWFALRTTAIESPQFTTKTQLEGWRKAHGIRPRDVTEQLEGPPDRSQTHFNANSPQQVAEGMEQLGWEPTKFTDNGQAKTGELILYRSGFAAGRLVAAWRGYNRIAGFCQQWLDLQRNGKLYPKFNGNLAATNRSSAKRPNIQQIPTPKKRESGMKVLQPYGRRCRALFLPQDGWVLIGSDLVGIEVRLLAHFLSPYDGGELVELVLSGEDIHQRNAERIGIVRDQAKTVLYGSMYGQGPTSLAEQLGIPRSEAQEIIEAFTTGLPGFAEMEQELLTELRRTGRIELFDGRRLQCSSDHKALNYRIQGTGAILMKHWAMVSARRLSDTSYRCLAVVHDEIQGEALPMDVTAAERVLVQTATDVGEQIGAADPG
jgi:DNA polymerase I-like protein with 3'-5' exonuclease and polymerase domains